jgi:hypothetical protein
MRFGLPLLALWMLSLGIRVLFLDGIEVSEALRSDASFYVPLAWNLGNHGAYSLSQHAPFEPHLRFPPGYPLFLAPFFAGRDQGASIDIHAQPGVIAGAVYAMRAQVLVGSFLPVLVVLAARRIVPHVAAWVPGVLSACCPVLVSMCPFLVSETVYCVLLLLVVLAVGRNLARPTVAGAAVSGALCGFVALVRSVALLLPIALAIDLGFRGLGARRRLAGIALAVTALAVIAPWYVRERIWLARGVPPAPYLSEAIATSLYPDMRYGNAPRGLGHLADPDFWRVRTSMSAVMREFWRRVKADPWNQLRWHLFGRWIALWEFDQVGAPPIHVYYVKHGLFRPARINPGGGDEPLAAIYWAFRGIYWIAVPAVFLGGLLVAHTWRGDPTPARRNLELVYLVLAYTVVVSGMINPMQRYMWPARAFLYLLATWSMVEYARAAGVLLQRWRPRRRERSR